MFLTTVNDRNVIPGSELFLKWMSDWLGKSGGKLA